MKKNPSISILFYGLFLLICISCKKDPVPESPGQPVLSKVFRDGALESEYIYDPSRGLVRINEYNTETGMPGSSTKFEYDSRGYLEKYSNYNSAGKITSEVIHLKDSDGKFISSDFKDLDGTDSGKVTIRYKFAYNKRGQISRQSWNDPVTDIEDSYRLYFYYPNGNMQRMENYVVSDMGAKKVFEVKYTPAGEPLPASLIKHQGYPVNFIFFLLTAEKIVTTTFDAYYYDAGEYQELITDRTYNNEGLVVKQTLTTKFIQPAASAINESLEFAYENIHFDN